MSAAMDERDERLEADRAELTLRAQLLRALTGWPIHRESAIEILKRWDAMERFADEVKA